MLVTADIKLVKSTNEVKAVFNPSLSIGKLVLVSDSAKGSSSSINVVMRKDLYPQITFGTDALDLGSVRFFKGEKGDIGPRGEIGPIGPKGEDGYSSVTSSRVDLSGTEIDLDYSNIINFKAFNANDNEVSLCIKKTMTGLQVSSLVDMQGLYLIVTTGD